MWSCNGSLEINEHEYTLRGPKNELPSVSSAEREPGFKVEFKRSRGFSVKLVSSVCAVVRVECSGEYGFLIDGLL